MKIKLPNQIQIVSLIAISASSLTATPILLNNEALIKTTASYLYFSATDADNFLKKAFYPGTGSGNAPSNLKPDGSLPSGSIDSASVASSWFNVGNGDLTDNNTATSVNGWGGFTKWQANGKNRGPYVLFDLGAEYQLSQVDIKLSNATAQGWNGDANTQQIWTATSLSSTPGTGISLDSSINYWTQKASFTYTASTSVSTYSIFLSSAPTRYVLLLLTAGNVDSNNAGGIINDVNFYIAGSSVPEPATTVLFLGIGSFACILFIRTRR